MAGQPPPAATLGLGTQQPVDKVMRHSRATRDGGRLASPPIPRAPGSPRCWRPAPEATGDAIPAEPRRLAALIVALRSKYTRASCHVRTLWSGRSSWWPVARWKRGLRGMSKYPCPGIRFSLLCVHRRTGYRAGHDAVSQDNFSSGAGGTNLATSITRFHGPLFLLHRAGCAGGPIMNNSPGGGSSLARLVSRASHRQFSRWGPQCSPHFAHGLPRACPEAGSD